jgi:hypothetical protein
MYEKKYQLQGGFMNPLRPRPEIKPRLQAAWQVCKAHRLPRDLRRLVVHLIHVWEWNELDEENRTMWCSCSCSWAKHPAAALANSTP